MRILCVIPSRMGSTRTPRKPLLPIHGKPMIQWVYENARLSKIITDVVVATDSQEIMDVVASFGGKALMTSPDFQTGSDRVAAVAKNYEDMDVIINLQGDEPFIKPTMLETLVQPYLDGQMPCMTTLARPLNLSLSHAEPGAVKVITDLYDNAIYFSRAPIPYFRVDAFAPVYHHIGLYAFQRDFLLKYTTLSQSPLEKTESLEQLRALEHGYKIRVCFTDEDTLEINTPEEYAAAQKFVFQTTSTTL